MELSLSSVLKEASTMGDTPVNVTITYRYITYYLIVHLTILNTLLGWHRNSPPP